MHLVKLTHARPFTVISHELTVQPPSCFLFQHLPVSKCLSGSYQLSVRNQNTTQIMLLHVSFYVAFSPKFQPSLWNCSNALLLQTCLLCKNIMQQSQDNV